MRSRRPRRYLFRSLWAIGILAAAYPVTAYLVLPALWYRYEHQPGRLARPMITATVEGIPGDPLNVGLVGSREEVVRALARSGWHAADPITLRSSIEIGVSVVLARPYPDAPESSLFYDGRRQDLAFEKPVGLSPAERHHVRLWLVSPGGAQGRDLWLGAASFDRRVGLSHDTGQITHHIDPDLDAERAYVIESLSAADALAQTYSIRGVGPTSDGRNGEGDRSFTDGDIVVGVIAPGAFAERSGP